MQGPGLCNEESVWVLVNEAASNIDRLCKFGVKLRPDQPAGAGALQRSRPQHEQDYPRRRHNRQGSLRQADFGCKKQEATLKYMKGPL